MSVSTLSATDDQNVAATCELLVGFPPAPVNPHPPSNQLFPPHAPSQPQPRPTHRSLYSRLMSTRAEEGKTPFPSPVASRSRPAGCGKWGAVSIAVSSCARVYRLRDTEGTTQNRVQLEQLCYIYIVPFVLFCFWDPRTTTPPPKKNKTES